MTILLVIAGVVVIIVVVALVKFFKRIDPEWEYRKEGQEMMIPVWLLLVGPVVISLVSLILGWKIAQGMHRRGVWMH